MEGDSVFIHEAMRIQITFLLLAYCFSGARIGAFFHNGKAEVKGEAGQIDRLVFEGLTWKVRRYHYRRDSISTRARSTINCAELVTITKGWVTVRDAINLRSSTKRADLTRTQISELEQGLPLVDAASSGHRQLCTPPIAVLKPIICTKHMVEE